MGIKQKENATDLVIQEYDHSLFVKHAAFQN